MTVDRTELRRLHAAATQGKWFVVGLPWNQGKPYIVAGTEDPHGASFVCDLDDVTAEDERLTLDADAALIVAAVNALPALLDRLDALEAERQIGAMPHKCLNDECETMAYGTGYDACPSCGDTSGRDAGQT